MVLQLDWLCHSCSVHVVLARRGPRSATHLHGQARFMCGQSTPAIKSIALINIGVCIACDCVRFQSCSNHGATIWANDFNGSENVPHTCTPLCLNAIFPKTTEQQKNRKSCTPSAGTIQCTWFPEKMFLLVLLAFSVHSGADSANMWSSSESWKGKTIEWNCIARISHTRVLGGSTNWFMCAYVEAMIHRFMDIIFLEHKTTFSILINTISSILFLSLSTSTMATAQSMESFHDIAMWASLRAFRIEFQFAKTEFRNMRNIVFEWFQIKIVTCSNWHKLPIANNNNLDFANANW